MSNTLAGSMATGVTDAGQEFLLGALPLELLYDSWSAPVPDGLRNPGASGARIRQLMYGAPPYVLDLRMELDGGAPLVRLVGQVVHSPGPGTALKNVPVHLVAGSQVVAEAFTNGFGEFHLEYPAEQDFTLVVQVGGEEVIRLPLPAFTRAAEGP